MTIIGFSSCSQLIQPVLKLFTGLTPPRPRAAPSRRRVERRRDYFAMIAQVSAAASSPSDAYAFFEFEAMPRRLRHEMHADAAPADGLGDEVHATESLEHMPP